MYKGTLSRRSSLRRGTGVEAPAESKKMPGCLGLPTGRYQQRSPDDASHRLGGEPRSRPGNGAATMNVNTDGSRSTSRTGTWRP